MTTAIYVRAFNLVLLNCNIIYMTENCFRCCLVSCVKKTHNLSTLSVLEINKLVVIIKTRSIL